MECNSQLIGSPFLTTLYPILPAVLNVPPPEPQLYGVDRKQTNTKVARVPPMLACTYATSLWQFSESPSPGIRACSFQVKKLALAGGDASIRIIDIIEEKAAVDLH